MPAAPPVSVIVVCKNPGDRLRSALGSVWAQRDVTPELIVIDGASTDGTVAWLEMERARIAFLRSESDRGIYDAMNQGVAAATGDWVLFLGADDRLAAETTLAEAAPLLAQSHAEVAVGEVEYDDGRIYRLEPRFNPATRNFVHHQAAFYRRSLFGQHRGFDPAFAIMGDYEFNARLWKQNARFESIALRIARCGSGGVSDAGRWRGYREELEVRHRHFPFASSLPWDAVSIMRFLRKKIVRALRTHHG